MSVLKQAYNLYKLFNGTLDQSLNELGHIKLKEIIKAYFDEVIFCLKILHLAHCPVQYRTVQISCDLSPMSVNTERNRDQLAAFIRGLVHNGTGMLVSLTVCTYPPTPLEYRRLQASDCCRFEDIGPFQHP